MNFLMNTFGIKSDEESEAAVRKSCFERVNSSLNQLSEIELKSLSDNLSDQDYAKFFGNLFAQLDAFEMNEQAREKLELQSDQQTFVENEQNLKLKKENFDQKLTESGQHDEEKISLQELNNALQRNRELSNQIESLTKQLNDIESQIVSKSQDSENKISSQNLKEELLRLNNEIGIKEDEINLQDNLIAEAKGKAQEASSKVLDLRSSVENTRIEILNDLLKSRIAIKNTFRKNKKRPERKHANPLESFRRTSEQKQSD